MAVPTRISRFTDANYEPVTQDRVPIKGFEDAPIVPLEDTLKRVSKFFIRIEEEAWVAKKNCQQPKEGLTQDESASIHLYTMQFKGGPSLFQVLNENLRAENREDLTPWFRFLKLFITALCKLPSHVEKVWRGVRGIDLSAQYPRNKKFFWWGITSCTTNLEVLESENFLGKTGKRTLFSIDCQHGKSVALHSYFKNKEEEIILMPGSYFQVISLANPAEGLHIIHIKEIEPPFPTVARLIEKMGAFRSNSKITSAKNSSFSQASLHSSPNTIATTYRVNVITSKEFGSGTCANVYIIIFGEDEDTGKIPLATSKTHNDPFESGHTDLFEIEAMDIGEPKKIKIGHDNAGFRPDWLLERVEIDIPKFGQTWIFPCGKWLSKTKGDCQLEVEIYAKSKPTEIYNPYVPYQIKVYTSKKLGAGTDANVFIEIYGLDKSTGQVMLCGKTDRKGKFQTGSIDTFVLELEDVGEEIEKIRIGHDNKGYDAAWHLDHVEIGCLLKGQKTNTYIFPCNRWFAKDEDDKRIVRELIPDRIIEEKLDKHGQLKVKEKDVRDLLEIKQYQIDVYTGDKFACGTNANVFCTIYGDKGDTGERELANSETHMDKFERKHVDRFRIESADLGNIFKLKIRHDNSGISPDWLLSKVEVIDDIKTYVFYCEQWLSKGKEGKLERTLYEKDYQGSNSSLGSVPRSVGGSKISLTSNASANSSRRGSSLTLSEKVSYKIEVTTSDKKNAGTTQNGWIIIEGKNKRSERFYMKNTSTKNILRSGQTNQFTFESRPMGELHRIILGHEEQSDYPLESHYGREAQWFVTHVTITDSSTGTIYHFPIGEWIDINNNGDIFECHTKEEDFISQQRHRRLINYKIIVHTGNVPGAGTDAHVSIILYGTLGDTGTRVLRQKGRNLFEKNQIDEFTIECLELGELTKLHIEHDNSGIFDSDWFLDKVEVVNLDKNERTSFPCNRWLGIKHDDHQIQRNLLPSVIF